MKVVVYLRTGSLTFTRPGTPGAYPLLVSVSTFRIAMRAGIQSGLGVGESPFITVVLDNSGRRASQLIGNPLRARVDVLNDDDSIFFPGIVSACTFGTQLSLTVET